MKWRAASAARDVDGREVERVALDPDDVTLVRVAESSQCSHAGPDQLRRLGGGGRVRTGVDGRCGGRESLGGDQERVADGSCGRVDAAVLAIEGPLERVRGGRDGVGVRPADPDAGQARRQSPQPDWGEIDPERLGRDFSQPVGLVEDHEIVFGEHRPAGLHVHAVERVIDHEHVRLASPGAGPLGEAVLAVGTLGCAGALVGRAGRGASRTIRDVDLGEVARVRGRHESNQAFEIAFQGGSGTFVEEGSAFPCASELRPADVLRTSLQERGSELDPSVLTQ